MEPIDNTDNSNVQTRKIAIRSMKMIDIGQTKTLNEKCLQENYQREYWIEKWQKGKENSFVAVFAKLIIGYVLCSQNHVISFAVDEQYRGKGLGKLLMQHCLNTCNAPVTLNVRVGNKTALALYYSLGFATVKVAPNYYSNPTEDAYEMVRKYGKPQEYAQNKYPTPWILKISVIKT